MCWQQVGLCYFKTKFVVVLVLVHVAALAQYSHWSPRLHDRCSWVTVQWVKVSPRLECHEHSLGLILFLPRQQHHLGLHDILMFVSY